MRALFTQGYCMLLWVRNFYLLLAFYQGYTKQLSDWDTLIVTITIVAGYRLYTIGTTT